MRAFSSPAGGEDCADLYTGAFARVAVVHEAYYNTNLLSVQVGDQPPIPVLPAAPGSIALFEFYHR